ncbi:RNA-directed DNA polymerase, eukaryota, reverse transcriptase zinc-binding domain protein [Tanacetum coccineum]
MSNMYTICRNEGFSDLNIHHVGGYWIWIQFPSSTACSKFQENESLKSFGKFLFFEKEDSSALSSGWVCISTKSHRLISKNVQVEINKELFEATVQEIGSWCTKINDDYIDTLSNGKLKDLDISSESIDDHSVDDLERIQTNLNNIDDQDFEQKIDHNGDNKEGEEDIHKIIPQQLSKEEINNKVSNPECKAESSDLSRPPGFDMARGRSGGLISVWDPNLFLKESIWFGNLPIGGRCFTWMNKADIRITALDRIWSDHNPILLHVDKIDFGPSPFKLYNSWLLRDGFDDLIKSEWDLLDSNKTEFPIKCHEKFRILKAKIRHWNNNYKTMDRNKKAVALEEITSIEKKINKGSASPSDTKNRLNLLHELEKINKLALMDLMEKARVKWDIEGDENSKFFHGLINKKRQNQMIIVKFQAQDSQVLFPNLPHSHTFNSMDWDYLERLVTFEEIKETVWDCGSSKAPGPDGFSFAFVKKYWDIIQKDLYDFINSFFASSELPYGANSSFFTLIPKVNNPTLITDFRPISLIGIHYKIIAKILANRLSKVIDKIVSKEQSAFIAGLCPSSLRASILINGSPTSEFSINRGLRQGDPLSPFVFILVMEGLHNAFAKAVGNGLISDININNSTINISHLFFVDDVIITTD